MGVESDVVRVGEAVSVKAGSVRFGSSVAPKGVAVMSVGRGGQVGWAVAVGEATAVSVGVSVALGVGVAARPLGWKRSNAKMRPKPRQVNSVIPNKTRANTLKIRLLGEVGDGVGVRWRKDMARFYHTAYGKMGQMSPLIPLIILLVGAGLLWAGLVAPTLSFPAATGISATALALAAFLIMGWRLPAFAALSNWGLTLLLPVGLRLTVDPLMWLFGLSVLSVTLTTLLTGLARPGGRRVVLRGAVVLLTFAALAALSADNLPTRIMAWAGLDLIYFLALVLLTRGEGVEPQAVLNLAFNATGTLCAVGAAVFISRTSPALTVQDATLSPISTWLITLAAAFRLGLFPLHLGLPAETQVRQGLGVVLRLLPAAVALEVVGRLALFGFPEAARPWLAVFGVAAALVGAAQWWMAADARQGITYVVIAQSGVALLAGLYGGPLALTAQAVAMLMGGALVFLAPGHDDRQPGLSALAGLGAAAMLGAPLTVGFVGASGLYGGLWRAGQWATLAGVIMAQIIFAASCLRTIFWPAQPLEEDRRGRAAHWLGLALLAVGLVLTALMSEPLARALRLASLGWFGVSGLSSLGPLLGVGVSALAGFGLWRADDLVRARAEVTGEGVVAVLRLQWLYRALWAIFWFFSQLSLAVANVLEGEGALLWALVAGVLLWVLAR